MYLSKVRRANVFSVTSTTSDGSYSSGTGNTLTFNYTISKVKRLRSKWLTFSETVSVTGLLLSLP